MLLASWLAQKQRYLTDGSLEDLETHGRKRLLPHLAHVPVHAITEQHIRDWLARMIEQQRSGAFTAKTINNARAALSCALADASRHKRCRATRYCLQATTSDITGTSVAPMSYTV